MAQSKSLLIIGFDHRLVPEQGQIDIGPHVMHLQTPLANMQTEEIGYFRLPQGRSYSWKQGYYATFGILHDTVFMFGSSVPLHQQDIWVIRNCGIEVYYHNGKPVKFMEPIRIRAAATYSYQGIYTILFDPYNMDHILIVIFQSFSS